ncbi:autophagy-related protein 101-like [Haemaphysalis longicornis]
MNARSEVFELFLEGRQVQEAVLSLFHTLLFHRTLGKVGSMRSSKDATSRCTFFIELVRRVCAK